MYKYVWNLGSIIAPKTFVYMQRLRRDGLMKCFVLFLFFWGVEVEGGRISIVKIWSPKI